MIRLHYPYACPNCGATIQGTLASDPETPYYSCGRVGRGRCPRTMAPVDPNPDLVLLTDDDWSAFVALVGTIPLDRPASRIGLCEVMHCEVTAIDGRCMEHAPMSFSPHGELEP
jgi:hypothetical protein